MPAPLVARPRAAAVTAFSGLIVLLGLGFLVRDTDHGIGPDNPIHRWIVRHFDMPTRYDMVHLTDVPVVVVAVCVLVVAAVVLRRIDVAVLAVTAPCVAVGLTEFVFKPFFGRTNPIAKLMTGTNAEAYPSGHEAATSAVLVLLGLLLVRSTARLPLKCVGVAALVAYFVVTVLGLVGQYYHYATDTVGALALAVFVVLSGALLVDRVRG